MSGSSITPGQIKCIRAMIAKLNLTEQKENIISGASEGRTVSTKELTVAEGIALIKYLKGQDPEEIRAEVMRRKIISMAHECGYRIPGTKKIDMAQLDGWCVQYGYLHKKLNQYTYQELPKLVTQFEMRYSDFLNAL